MTVSNLWRFCLPFIVSISLLPSGCSSVDAVDDAGSRCSVENDVGMPLPDDAGSADSDVPSSDAGDDAGADAGSGFYQDAGIKIKCADTLPAKCNYDLCEEHCAVFSGVMSQHPNGQPYCKCPTSDGGKKCNTKSDCEGECIKEVDYYQINHCEDFPYGNCTYWQFELGCHCEFFDGPPAIRVCGD